MDNSSSIPPPSDTPQARFAVRTAVARILSDAGVGLVYLFLGINSGDWQLYLLSGVALLMVLLDVQALRWARQNKIEQMAWLLTYNLLPAVFINAVLITGFGPLSLSAAIVAILIGSQFLPARQLNRIIILSLSVGVLSILVDLFLPSSVYRLAVPVQFQTFILAIVGLLILIFSVFLLRRFNEFSLRTKFILTFLFISIAPLTLLSILNDRLARTTLTEEANQKLFAAATQASTSVDAFIISGLETVGQAAQLPLWREYLSLPPEERDSSGLRAEATSLLLALRNTRSQGGSPVVRGYALLDNEGHIVLDTGLFRQLDPEVNLSQRDFIRQPLTTFRSYVSPVEFVPEANQPVIYFAAPIRVPAQEPFGVIIARFNASSLQQIVAANNDLAGQDSFAILFNDDFSYLAHGRSTDNLYRLVGEPDPDLAAQLQNQFQSPLLPFNQLFIDLPELEEDLLTIREQPFFEAQDPTTGERINQVAAAQLQTQPWFILFFQPQDVFLAATEAQSQTAVLFTLILAALIAFIAVFASQQLARPISNLTEVATTVASGDLTARANVQTEDEIGSLAQTFNSMTTQLQQILAYQERRIADRTRALEVSSEVSRRLSTILEEERLVNEVVEQVKNAFQYYHTHIYLLDKDGQTLRMAGGTGPAGQKMLQEGHQISLGQGLVGRAAATNAPVLVIDVSQESNWLPNPLLPETKAEAAIPISLGEEVLGVLDVQHNVDGGLQQEDADLLQAIANQVAIALQNARSYARAQRLAEQEARINAINQKILSTSTVDSALQVAIRELGRSIKAKETIIRLDTQDGDETQAELPGKWTDDGD